MLGEPSDAKAIEEVSESEFGGRERVQLLRMMFAVLVQCRGALLCCDLRLSEESGDSVAPGVAVRLLPAQPRVATTSWLQVESRTLSDEPSQRCS